MVIAIRHQLLATHITAIKVKEDFVFIGEGQHIHIHQLSSGERVCSTEVFCASVVHGIRILELTNAPLLFAPALPAWVVVLAVFGHKSLSIVTFCPVGRSCHVLVEEDGFADWIVDAAWEGNGSHLVIALAHNTLLRYQLLNGIQTGQNISNFDIHTPGSQNQNKNVVQKAECTEKSVLYSGCVVMTAGTWESAVLLAGTVGQEVLVWGTSGEVDNNNRIRPYHRLRGHQGSIFSVTYNLVQRIIATTSDDRTVRVWQVHPAETDTSMAETPSDSIHDHSYWRDSTITEKFACYGHSARIWKSLILPQCLVSVGEDSNVFVRNLDGTFTSSWRAHDGASIWVVAATENADQIVTGASDGSVRMWGLGSKDPVLVLSLAKFPNNSTQPSGDSPISSDTTQTNETAENPDSLLYYKDENEDGAPELFVGESEAKPTVKREKVAKSDFPRCVSLMGEGQIIVVMDSGRLYTRQQQQQPSSPWQLQYQDNRLRNYSVLQVSHDHETAALATLCGWIIFLSFEQDRLKVLMDCKVSEGKIFSVLWLSADLFLVCAGAGEMTVWIFGADSCTVTATQRHTLPASKQRWVSAACLYPMLPSDTTTSTIPIINSKVITSTTTMTPPFLVCGDLAGSLHLYHPEMADPMHSLHGVHGRNGVTSVVVRGKWVLSSGRDGCVRSLTVHGCCLQVITVTRVSGVSWVARIVFSLRRTLAICFHDVKMKVWSVEEERDLVELECGGGHRSWDIRFPEGHDNNEELVFLFLKDARAFMSTASLRDKLLPVIKSPLNSRETLCLQVLHSSSEGVVFATGGEDTTLRLHSITGDDESRRSLAVIRSHICSVRALCVIGSGGNVHEETGLDEGDLWLVSAGGRAQVKIWKTTTADGFSLEHMGFTDKQGYLHSVHPSTAMIEWNDNPSTVADETEPDGEEGSSTNRQDNENTACTVDSDGIICQEVTSHMLRTGSHKTWKSQELTFDPETRYMDVTAFWITESRAFVLLASSDGALRIFQFSAFTAVKLVYTEECKCCILKVARLHVAGRTLLISATTKGDLIFWDAQSMVDWMKQQKKDGDTDSPPPQLIQLARVHLHQSGINSLAFTRLNESTAAYPGTRHHVAMATGGDDNKLGVWQVSVDTGGEGRPMVSVVSVCDAHGHASQITGLHWLSDHYLASTSVDQRLLVWQLDSVDGKAQQHRAISSNEEVRDTRNTPRTVLKCVTSRFTGVPDVKGLAVVDCGGIGDQQQGHTTDTKKKKVLVYGMGLQVLELTMSD